jgi:hypothetical protein
MKDNVHVLPVNDSFDHKETGFNCKCNPKLQKQLNGVFIIVHNSYDGRELKERGELSQ